MAVFIVLVLASCLLLCVFMLKPPWDVNKSVRFTEACRCCDSFSHGQRQSTESCFVEEHNGFPLFRAGPSCCTVRVVFIRYFVMAQLEVGLSGWP